ncbi:MAG: hypothetical protein IV088_13180 [Hydrogenophaga sp.]|uniref:hypothetical protein n=1 Tax=Hydrogenophaga sp. TaxID=1904254 RepID=UPI0025C498CF|nr:hypothetical protein [Hydrogenophaga sp.]MBT9551799.1 hypothetical protein [Hydrogenophaga sp.]
MLEKLAWMRRSTERIRANLSNPADVQDHFLSFTHASHLLYFYFAGWAKGAGKASNAKALIELYLASIEPKAAEVWRCLQELRTEDVHINPVSIINTEQPGALMLDGHELLLDGYQLMAGEYRYVVQCAGTTFDVLDVCETGLEVKRRFCDEFDSI